MIKIQKPRFVFQQGISLLEVLLSLSVIAIILVMASRYYLSARNSVSANDTMQRMALMKTAVQEYYAYKDSYVGIDFDQVAARFAGMQLVADPTQTGQSALYTTWGNHAITISTTGTGDTTQAQIKLDGLVDSQCDYLSTRVGPVQGMSDGSTTSCSTGAGGTLFTLTLTN